MLTANQRQQISDLQSYLIRVAQNIVSSYYPEQDPVELLQTMNAAICERAAADPTFLDQTRAYVVKAGAWAARDYCRRERYGRALAPQSLDASQPLAELLPAPLADPDLQIDVRRALATLDRKRQEIAAMLAGGFKRKEIAARFGVRSPTLSWDLGKIRAALLPVYTAARG